VPADSPGFEARPIKGKLGLRAQDTAEIFLDGVRVPDENRLGELGSGFKVAMSALDHGRISLGAGCVGISQGCLDASIAYTKERKQFGRPVASFQLVQELLADIAVETEAARLLVWRAAATADAGEKYTLEASIAKYFASEVAVRAANAAVQAHGGYGYVDEYPVGKYLRDARVTTLYEGTSQIQKRADRPCADRRVRVRLMDDVPAHITVRDAEEWRTWLESNHTTAPEICLLYWKKASGKPSINWAEAVEVALRFGWIDGLVRSIDEHRYIQRWTPRRPKSKWSNVNKGDCLAPDRGERDDTDGSRRGRGRQGKRRMGPRLHRATRYTDPGGSEGAAEGELRSEGPAASYESDTLGPLARRGLTEPRGVPARGD